MRGRDRRNVAPRRADGLLWLEDVVGDVGAVAAEVAILHEAVVEIAGIA